MSFSSRHATVMTKGRLAVGDVPGLKSVASATGMPRSMKRRGGSDLVVHQEERRRRQQDGDDRAARAGRGGERIDARRRRRGEMVGGQGADLRRQLRAAARRQLVGMEARLEPEAGGRLEDPACLVRAEDAALAEDVGEARPALRRDARQLLLEQVADVRLRAVRAGAELGRHRVGAEPRREDVDGPSLPRRCATSRSRSSVARSRP